MEVNVISPAELNQLIQSGVDVQLIDLRESYELEHEGQSNALHIPMGDLVSRLDELNFNCKVVFHCSSGNRSLNILKFLKMNNLSKENFFHLEGGFQEWSKYL